MIEPQAITAHAIGDVLNYVKGFAHKWWMFRGQADIEWQLRPKAGREEYFVPNSMDEEDGYPNQDLIRFDQWRHNAIAYHPSLPENPFECLACAQHYGLATRLLDWTTNPLIALFFAVEERHDRDGGLYMFLPETDEELTTRCFKQVDRCVRFTPRPFDKRILNQYAVFSYHPQPDKPLAPERLTDSLSRCAPEGTHFNLMSVCIPSRAKGEIASQLDQLGINRRTLFPDLDGLSALINWQTRQVAGQRPGPDPMKPQWQLTML